ncbi:hypothetical protein AAGG52_04995 [Bacillus licheniformis]
MENQEYEILSIHVGRPCTYEFDGKQVETAIMKEPVGGPVYLSRTNFEGDGQADLIHHGERIKRFASIRRITTCIGKAS